MRNFYEVKGQFFLNIDSYIQEWVKKIDIISPDQEFNKLKLQSLGSLSQNLWKNFNADRDEKSQVIKDKHYMESSSGLQAYSASFLLPNIERVFSLLVKDENIFAIRNFLLQKKEELVIVDFGCGPLSATVGFLCVLEYLLTTNPDLVAPKKIKVLAIERSEKIFQYGFDLLKKSIFNKDSIIIERFSSTEKVSENIDIALCVNIFNEIPIKHRLVNLVNLYNKLTINGAVLIIEPGQEIHAKALGSLRNEFLAKAEQCEIISPCSHKNNCPLSTETSRSDWCWFRHGWNQPAALKEIDKYSKIDHHFLNFSYLFFMKSKVKTHEPFYARVVSDKLNVGLQKKSVMDYFKNNLLQGDIEALEYAAEHKNLLKVLMCTEDGTLKSTFFDEMDEEEFKRGMRFIRENSLKFIFNERGALPPKP